MTNNTATIIATVPATAEKTFTVAGISCLKGEYKVRFANDLESRCKVLHKNGHTDVRLIELANGLALSKKDCATYLFNLHATTGNDLFNDAIAVTTISDFLAVKDTSAPRVAKVKAKNLVVDDTLAEEVVSSVIEPMADFYDADFLETPVDLTNVRKSVGLPVDEDDTEDQPF